MGETKMKRFDPCQKNVSKRGGKIMKSRRRGPKRDRKRVQLVGYR